MKKTEHVTQLLAVRIFITLEEARHTHLYGHMVADMFGTINTWFGMIDITRVDVFF